MIALDIDKLEQLEEMRRELRIVLARGAVRISPGRKYMTWWMRYLTITVCVWRDRVYLYEERSALMSDHEQKDRRNLCTFHIQNRQKGR